MMTPHRGTARVERPKTGASMRGFVLLALALSLAGCEGMREAAAKRAAARAETSCRALGLTPESEKWQECLIQMMAAERSRAVTTHDNARGMSFMCKDATARGDSGAIRTFC